MKKSTRNSTCLGILSIISAFFMPVLGLVLGIIGFVVKEEDGAYNKAIVLNFIGVLLSSIILCINSLM